MEFEVNGVRYRSGKLNAKQQFHVARRLFPLLSGVGSDPNVSFDKVIGGISMGIATIPDADCDYVIDTCMSVVQRKQGESWANVYNVAARRYMFEDIDLAAMLKITAEVIREFIGPFLSSLPSALPASDGTENPALPS